MRSEVLDLLAASQDGVYAVDMDQRIVFWNRSATALLGWTAAEALGRRCWEVIGGQLESQAQCCEAGCNTVLLARQGSIAPSQTILTHTKERQPVWLRVTHVVIPGRRRELTTLVHIFGDVSQEVEAKRLLRQLSGVVAFAIQTPKAQQPQQAPSGDGALDTLSPREREVLRLMAQGVSTSALAKRLVISSATVRNHIQHIMSKLGAHTRLEAVAAASRHKLM